MQEKEKNTRGLAKKLNSNLERNDGAPSPPGSILAPYSPQTKGERRVIEVFLILSLAVVIAVVAFYFTNPSPNHVIGNQLVNNANGGPEEFPPPGTFPLYAKPLTYLFGAGIVFGYCFFSLSQGIINTRFPRSLRSLFLIVSVLSLGMGLYEVFFNFTLWGAMIVNHIDPDTAVNLWPINTVQINLAYATKMTVLWTIVSFFSVMTFKKSLEA